MAGNKAYLGRARMTRWWESADEPREFHVGRDGMSLAEWLGGDDAFNENTSLRPDNIATGQGVRFPCTENRDSLCLDYSSLNRLAGVVARARRAGPSAERSPIPDIVRATATMTTGSKADA